MAGITTNMCTSFKQELLQAGHNFAATVTPTATATSASASVTAVSSMTGVAVGMPVSGTGIAANTVVARITSATALTLSAATTAAISGGALTIAGDSFFMALIGASPTGTYTTTNVNYTDLGSDEVASGGGYTTTGQVLTNVSPTTGGGVAWINFSPNPSWSSATFSTSGCMIYNSSVRDGGTSGTNTTGGGRACGVFSFSGVQQVTSGTLTVLMPSSGSTTAILRLS